MGNIMLVWNRGFTRQLMYRIISSTNFNAQFSLFINNTFVTLLLMNKENCALKLVDEIILY